MNQKNSTIVAPSDLALHGLPPEAAHPDPKGLLGLGLNMTINAVGFWLILLIENVMVRIVISVLWGCNWAVTGLYVHELIHGQIVRSPSIQKLIATPCMYYSMLAPSFWSHWHLIHHRFGTLDENLSGFQTINWARAPGLRKLLEKITPPKQGCSAFFYLFFWKSFASFVNQFFYFAKPRFKKKINRARMAAELIFLIGLHILAWSQLSKSEILFIEIIPWVVQNFIASAIVVTNHHPRLIEKGFCHNNSCSITLGSAHMDTYFLNSGYHIEHHLFPSYRGKYLPLISSNLKKTSHISQKEIRLIDAHRVIFGRPSSPAETAPEASGAS